MVSNGYRSQKTPKRYLEFRPKDTLVNGGSNKAKQPRFTVGAECDKVCRRYGRMRFVGKRPVLPVKCPRVLSESGLGVHFVGKCFIFHKK
jgi:hypothetical protein